MRARNGLRRWRIDAWHDGEKVLGEVELCVYRVPLNQTMRRATRGQDEMTETSTRQRRSDVETAKAVARGVNILAVRNRSLAQHYMECMHVPPAVIARVLDDPASRRAPSAEQAISEAISPSSPARRSEE